MTKTRRHVARAYTAAVLFFFAGMIGVASAAELSGRVVAVADGDTFTLLTDTKEQIRVRLLEIDAPESAQPWGRQAKDALSALVFQQQVRVVSTGLDQYGRTLGRVYVAGKDVNAEMLRTGSAWAYRQYLTDASLIGIEGEARAAKRGLWSLSMQDTESPWECVVMRGRPRWSIPSTRRPRSRHRVVMRRRARRPLPPRTNNAARNACAAK